MVFMAAITGCTGVGATRAATKVSGFPCSRSPASTSTTRPGWARRTESTMVAAPASERAGSARLAT